MSALNTTFNEKSNAPFNNILFSTARISAMHESMERLYKAAKDLRGVTGQTNVADLLGQSPQTVKNWESRGVSKTGAITAQEKIGCSAAWITHNSGTMTMGDKTQTYPVPATSYRRVWVIGKGQGGLPERIWTDGDHPVGNSDQYADISSADPHAFLVPVVGDSMTPRYQPGEFALVEPSTEPDLEDDVLVRLATGETMLMRLPSRRAGYRFGSYNDPAVLPYAHEDVTWIYYVAHPVPARKIKNRI